MNKLKIKKLDNYPNKKISIPTEDVGIDLYSAEDVFIFNSTFARIQTGISMQPPQDYWIMIKDRSSKSAVYETNAGIIDCGYTGEILVSLRATQGNDKYTDSMQLLTNLRIVGKSGISGVLIRKGDKIAQAIIMKNHNKDFEIEEVSTLEKTNRQNNGFGSTGR